MFLSVFIVFSLFVVFFLSRSYSVKMFACIQSRPLFMVVSLTRVYTSVPVLISAAQRTNLYDIVILDSTVKCSRALKQTFISLCRTLQQFYIGRARFCSNTHTHNQYVSVRCHPCIYINTPIKCVGLSVQQTHEAVRYITCTEYMDPNSSVKRAHSFLSAQLMF